MTWCKMMANMMMLHPPDHLSWSNHDKNHAQWWIVMKGVAHIKMKSCSCMRYRTHKETWLWLTRKRYLFGPISRVGHLDYQAVILFQTMAPLKKKNYLSCWFKSVVNIWCLRQLRIRGLQRFHGFLAARPLTWLLVISKSIHMWRTCTGGQTMARNDWTPRLNVWILQNDRNGRSLAVAFEISAYVSTSLLIAWIPLNS